MALPHGEEIKGLLIDLDDTLYFYARAHHKALQAFFERLSDVVGQPVEQCRQLYEDAKHQVKEPLAGTAASHHRLLYIQKILENCGCFSVANTYRLYRGYWDTFLFAMQPVVGMYAFMKRVSCTKKICIITNLTADIQYRKLLQLGIADFVHYLVTSEELGKEKPDKAIFLHTLAKMKLEPNEVLMIGDDLENDMRGATALNIPTLWICHDSVANVPQEKKWDQSFNNFNELAWIV